MFAVSDTHARATTTPTHPGSGRRTGNDFYSGAVERIRYFMAGLAGLLAAAWWKFGLVRAGFALGCAIAYLNFHWLKRGVSGLADRVTNAGKPQSGKGSWPVSCCVMFCWAPPRMLY